MDSVARMFLIFSWVYHFAGSNRTASSVMLIFSGTLYLMDVCSRLMKRKRNSK